MNRIIIDLEALHHNIEVVDKWMADHGATWTLVTKVLCGHPETLKGLQSLGVRSIGDSRLTNLQAIERIVPDFEAWYLRLPHLGAIESVVTLTDVSLNSETETIEALNAEAERQGKVHRIIVMIELGDLREGILPGTLTKFYNHIFELPNLEVLGIGANLGCLSGTVPNVDQLTQLALYKELLELKFQRKLPMISAGSSAVLPLLLQGKVPRPINHFRIGEAVFLGTDLVYGGTLPGLRDDAITVEADIVEIKEKSLLPLGETTSMTPFEPFQTEGEGGGEQVPGQRGYRAVITLGQLDTDVTGLTPNNPKHLIAGASSDLMVVNLGEESGGLKVGDTIKFSPNYAAFLRAMSTKYIEKYVVPSVVRFADAVQQEQKPNLVPPVLEQVAEEESGTSGSPVTGE
jgi:predicted amino acid racemase